jgi:hypothetical protein
MAGGKVHGKGGKKGHHSYEMDKKTEKSFRLKKALERRENALGRRINKKVSKIEQDVRNKYDPFCSRLMKSIMLSIERKVGSKISRPEAMLRLLALDAWFKDSIIRDLKKANVNSEQFDSENRFGLLDEKARVRALTIILGESPSVYSQKSLVERISRLKLEAQKKFEGKPSRFD